jgi:phospholipid/cholesterol/gamma-HCH transport system substrate-binding protein
MPERTRVRWSQLKVGVVALAAFLILFVLVFLLTSSKGFFRRYEPLYTYMADASGLADGTTVRLNGFTVGYLDRVTLTNSRDPDQAVKFDMRVKPQYLSAIPVDSVVEISAANLLGDKFLNITRGKSTQTVKPGAVLPSLRGQDIPELMAQSANLLKSFQTIVNRVDSLLAGVEAGKGNIGLLLKDRELYDRLNGIASEGQQLLADVRHGNGTVSKLLYSDELYRDIRSPLQRIDAMMADLQAGQGTAGMLLKNPALFNDAQRTLAEIRELVTDLNSGKGTAGKLLKDEQLYQRLDALVAKFNTTVDKMNSGQGTIGQLLVNPQLYTSMNAMTRELQGLVTDIRANPKKFLTLRLALF